MTVSPKKIATLGVLAATLGYMAQNYTIHGLSQLRLEPRQGSATEPALETGGWDLADRASLLRPSVHATSPLELPSSSRAAQSPVPTTPGRTASQAFPSPAAPTTSWSSQPVSAPHAAPLPPTIQVATFNLHHFDRQKADNPFIMEMITRIVRRYDVVALQEITTRQQDLLPLLVERINRGDRHFDYLIGPRVGRTDDKEQFAFLFDTTRIETDRDQLYSVDDPEDLLQREPLVGWFRCKGAPPELAFTFTLVNLRLDTESGEREVLLLPELVRSIQRDGRQEDDIILVGDFGASDRELQFLRTNGMIFGLEGVPTTPQGNAMLDNIVMPVKATDEFTGKSGIFDFLRQFNLSIDQAHQISDHLPVWTEFSAVEGGIAGRVQ